MKRFIKAAAPTIAIALTACAGFSGRGLIAGQSTAEQVEALMGTATGTRREPSGETVRYYSRLPSGYETFAAHIGPDGKLRRIDQVLTSDNIAKLHAGISRADDVRVLLGPPYRTDAFPRLERDVWSYKAHAGGPGGKDLYIQFSPDGLVREVLLMDEFSGG